MPVDSKDKATRSPTTRSRITNGTGLFLPGTDGRGVLARRFRDIYYDMVSDLGGDDQIGAAQAQLCRRAAGLAVQLEDLEGALVGGTEVETDRYTRLTASLCRVLSSLGIDKTRYPKDVTPDLASYLAARGDDA